jgi:hypothetical protein
MTLIWGEHHERTISSLAELDQTLDAIHAEFAPAKMGMLAELYAEDGSSLTMGLGRDQTVVTYAGPDGMPPYYLSEGDPLETGLVRFHISNQDSEFPRSALVSASRAREAMRTFFRTGRLPPEIKWNEG